MVQEGSTVSEGIERKGKKNGGLLCNFQASHGSFRIDLKDTGTEMQVFSSPFPPPPGIYDSKFRSYTSTYFTYKHEKKKI